MSEVLEVSNWEKFCILTLKSFYIALKNYKQTISVILTPPLLLMVIVIIRSLIHVNHRPSVIFRKIKINSSWTQELEEIESRREQIRRTIPDFNHSVYVPQPIVAFAPYNEQTEGIMKEAVTKYIRGVGLESHKTCDKLKSAMTDHHFFAGVCFDFDWTLPDKIETTLVFPSELRIYNDSYIGATWDTNQLYDQYNSFEQRRSQSHKGGYVGYIREGFAAIQNAVALSYISVVLKKDVPNINIRRFPFHSQIDDPFTRNIKVSLSLFLVCGYIYPVLMFTTKIVKEKKSQVKKVIKAIGIGNWIHIAAWFTKFFILLLISAILICMILKIQWHDGRGILPKSSPLVLILCLIAYNTASISFSIMMSTFFAHSSIAVPLTGIIWVCSYLPYVASNITSHWLEHLQPLMCCFCNTVLALIIDQAIEFEAFNNGLDFNSLARSSYSDPYMFSGAYIGLLFGLSIVYILIAAYVEEIHLGLSTSWKWKFNSRTQRRDSKARSSGRRETVVNEIEPEYKNVILRVENLSKAYKGEFAVKNVSVNFYEGDITVLMGHNGAGKSCFLGMLAGMIIPTRGKVIIEGLDAIRYKNVARRHFGICMHEGCLFPGLHVGDQLRLFARLRGLRSVELENGVKKFINVMNLDRRTNLSTDLLSPGERRFLSVCCALIGNTKIILLDEPSRSMDIIGKRSLWELLKSESRTKTIILTSHSEEEAEALGDRIGILCGGELKCFGSTFFLKKVYGEGHRLILYKRKTFRKEEVINLIQSHTPNTQVEYEIGSQISYIIEDIGSFTELFDDLENKADELGINGISVTEMNSKDIFLKMGVLDPNEIERVRHSDQTNDESTHGRDFNKPQLDGGSEKVTGLHLFINQCEVMMVKRVLSSVRNSLQSLLTLTMPIFFTAVSFSLLHIKTAQLPLMNMTFDLRQYPQSVTIHHISPSAILDNVSLAIYKAYVQQLFWNGLSHKGQELKRDFSNFNQYILIDPGVTADELNNKFLAGISVDENEITAYFNNFPLHTVPLALNLVHNAILRTYSPTARLKATFAPLPFQADYHIDIKSIPDCIGNYLAVNVSFCVGFTWTLSVIFLVRERKKRFKLFQQLCGVRGYVFWLNAFLFDIIIIILTTLMVILTIVLFEHQMFIEERTSGAYFLILLSAGICMCSANYLTSLILSDPVVAYISITVFNIIGTMTYWTYVEVFKAGFRRPLNIDPYIGILRIFPYFSLCNALVKCFNMAELSTICKEPETYEISTVLEKCKLVPQCCQIFNVWSFRYGVFSDLVYILAFGVICWILVFILESYNGWCRHSSPRTYNRIPLLESYDDFKVYEPSSTLNAFHESKLKAEQEVLDIDAAANMNKIVVCKQVCSKIGRSFSLNNITFSVNRGEIFAIMGENASGKSLLIKNMIGNVPIKSGNIHIDGVSLRTNLRSIYKKMCYCSQEDVFLYEYKIYELMRMTCLLRGIPNYQIRDMCEYLSKIMGFHMHMQKRLKMCTPGIRRRFYFACTLIGLPDLLVFDDAASSIDLAGQRQLLRILSEMREQGQTIILTSTSTQICESIVDHLMVLSYGQLIALSDPWSISQKYVNCYLLKMKVKKITVTMPHSNDWQPPRNDIVTANPFLKLADFIESKFPLFRVKDKLGNIVEYFIPFENTSLSDIYRVMQRHSFNLYVEDFTITSSTLPVFFMDILESQRNKTARLSNRESMSYDYIVN